VCAVLIVIALSGCSKILPSPTVTRFQAVVPPEALYRCPTVELPSGDYDNREVALLILRLWSAREICHGSLEQIKKYVEDEKKIIDTKKDEK